MIKGKWLFSCDRHRYELHFFITRVRNRNKKKGQNVVHSPCSLSARLPVSTYIVHMDKCFMPKMFITHHSWHSSIVDSLKSTSIASSSPYLIYSCDNAAHGFSAVLSSDELETLKKSPGFVSAYPDRSVTLDTIHIQNFCPSTITSGYGRFKLWRIYHH